MRNRCKTLLRDHSVPEVTRKACLQHAQSQPYLRPSPLEDLKDLPFCDTLRPEKFCVLCSRIGWKGLVWKAPLPLLPPPPTRTPSLCWNPHLARAMKINGMPSKEGEPYYFLNGWLTRKSVRSGIFMFHLILFFYFLARILTSEYFLHMLLIRSLSSIFHQNYQRL